MKLINRQNVDAAREIIEGCLPNEEKRVAVLTIFAKIVETAHRIAPYGWSTTLRPNRFTLNIGTRAMFGLQHHQLWLGISGSNPPPDLLEVLGRHRTPHAFDIDVPTYFAWIDVNEYLLRKDQFDEQLLATARYFAEKGRLAPWKKSHSPNVMRYAELVLGRPLPDPAHALDQDDTREGATDGEVQYWKIAPGGQASLWPEWLDGGHCSVGWSEVGDVSGMARPEFLARLKEVGEPLNWRRGAEQLWHFAHIPQGSRIIANRGTTEIVGIGTVVGPYYFVPGAHHAHRLPVEWDDTTVRSIKEDGWRMTLVRLAPERFEDLCSSPPVRPDSVRDRAADGASLPGMLEREPYTIDHALEDLFMDRADLTEILDSLRQKKNVILEGAPGVGKTFVAKRLAYALIGFKSEDQVEMVQFHQSYAYEDFIQGWRPTAGGFEIRNGVFFEFCRRATANRDETFVFIIDEINRGNLSKIFGELMMLIEADKRGPESKIPLTYRTDESPTFYVPENVYIIGMMNTADRSLAMVDYALRRRFRFHRLKPAFGSEAFRDFLRSRSVSEDLVTKLVDTMTDLNARISRDEKHLGSGYEIGHSFFCPADGTTADERWFQAVLTHEIAPLIKEYYFDDATKLRELRAVLKLAPEA